MELIDLPPELIEDILVLCDPLEVAKVAQTCVAMRGVIYFSEDSKLWRELYLSQPFDDPRACVGQDGNFRPGLINWRKDLQRIIRARTVVDDLTALKPGELEITLQTLLQLVCYVRPWTSNAMLDLSELSANLLWVAAKLRRGIFDRLQEKATTFAERQLAARLHTYFGLTKGDTIRSSIVRSRALVYLLRNYRPENEYGPFHPNGTVNWEHIQAIHHVVSTHLVDVEENEDFEYAIFPMSLPFTQILIPDGVSLHEDEDWAGVTGSWDVSFCFCDHRELLSKTISVSNLLLC